LWCFEPKFLQKQQQQQQPCRPLEKLLHPSLAGMQSYYSGKCSHNSSSNSGGGGGVSAALHVTSSSHLLGLWPLAAAATRCLRGVAALLR
jgi:hypothetical protein